MPAMDAHLLSALVVYGALAVYTLLDGFDLGVGTLTLFTRDPAHRSRMMGTLAPIWDGNETWLVLAVIALLGLFPTAYSVLLPALYLPLIVMLLSLACRGVAFEFAPQAGARRRLWELSFGVGSLLAALCQGLVVGAVIQGIEVSGRTFAGSVTDVLRPYPLLMGVTLACGYVVLGAGWLWLKTDRDLQRFAGRALSIGVGLLVTFGALAIGLAAAVQPVIAQSWQANGLFYASLTLLLVFCLYRSVLAVRRGANRAPFAWAAAAFASGLLGVLAVAWSDIVPFRIHADAASSAPISQHFLLWGVGLVLPIVVAYSAYAYYVFRGKTPVAYEE
jgi:cytochrome d ubiquinol oxidase subunit II